MYLFILLYFRIARHYNISDQPNRRSSHKTITLRGGGIIFPFAAFLWFLLFEFQQPWLIVSLLFIAMVSFLDDIKNLPSFLRLLGHIIAISVLFWQLDVMTLPWYSVIIAYIFCIGWLNAFNFMDGINGITAFYSLITLFSMLYLNQIMEFASQELMIFLIMAVLIFSFFNVRKQAKTFSGDVGSISMAFLLAAFMILLMMKTGKIEYILFFAIYGVDSVFTIIFRLINKENIFTAHRSHLYQYLCNELNRSHIFISSIYAIVQLGINILTIYLIQKNQMTILLFFLMLIILSLAYLLIRFRVKQKIKLTNQE